MRRTVLLRISRIGSWNANRSRPPRSGLSGSGGGKSEGSLGYPTTRGFVIPVDRVIGLANAMEMADAGAFLPEPEWLVDRE